MAKVRQTDVNINYKVNTVDVERGNALLARASKATDELKKSTDTYGRQAAGSYRFASRSIEGMTIEVARLKQQVKLASTQNTADIQRLSAQYKSAKLQLDAYNKSLLETSRNARQAATSSRGLAAGLSDVYTTVRALIAVGIARELVTMQIEMARLSGTVEGVEKAFNRLPNSTLLLESLRRATHGTVNDLELMQKALRANNFRIPLEQLGTLLEFATVKAQQTGQEVNHLVEYIVSGIGYRSIKRLDDLGFTLNRVKEALGGASLQAASMGEVMNAVTKLMKEDLQETGGFAETAATEVGVLTNKWHELRVAVSQKLENVGFIRWLGDVADSFKVLIDAFPVDRLQKVFSGANPIKWMGQMTDVIAYWQLNIDEVITTQEILNNATAEAARIEERYAQLTREQRIPLIDQEIKVKERAADEYFYQIQAMDMTNDKFSEENIARKKNLREIEETIRILKEYRKAQDAIRDDSGEKEDDERGMLMKPLTQVVDIRFKDPRTGAVTKEHSDKVLEDFFDMIEHWVDNRNKINPIAAVITPFLPMDELEKAIEANRSEIVDTATSIFQDQFNSIRQAEVDAFSARIDATRDFYSEQIELAGDNERAKDQLRIKEDRAIKKLEQQRADREKKAAKAGIRVSTALGIMKVFAGEGTFADKLIKALIVAAQGASQLLVADRARYYAKGEIDIKGPGTKTSDSIPAMLSRGESVMTADETTASRGILKAVRARKLSDRVLQEIVSGRSGGSSSVRFDDSKIVKELQALKNAQPDIIQRANIAYEVREKGKNYRQIVRSKSFRK